MSKKSYKRNQNRLYREIKRRIIAEQALKLTVPVIEIHRDIETLAIKNIVHNYHLREIEFVKTDMANKLVKKLVAEGFVEFFSRKNKYESIADVTEIEARICVVKPMQEAVEPIITPWAEDEDCNIVVAKRECGKCGYQFFTERPNFCENCGTPILWELINKGGNDMNIIFHGSAYKEMSHRHTIDFCCSKCGCKFQTWMETTWDPKNRGLPYRWRRDPEFDMALAIHPKWIYDTATKKELLQAIHYAVPCPECGYICKTVEPCEVNTFSSSKWFDVKPVCSPEEEEK